MKTKTDQMIQELSELMANNSYTKEYIKERLDNLAEVAKLEAQIAEHKTIRKEPKTMHPTYSLGQVGLTEPEQHSDPQL